MSKVITAIFDGEVLRPEEPVELRPWARYHVIIERAEPDEQNAETEHPLAIIGRLATDMGVADLAERHTWYAHGYRGEVADDSQS